VPQHPYTNSNEIFEDFTHGIGERWTETIFGSGILTSVNGALRMSFDSAHQGHYTDAQIDDYAGMKRASFPWRPPLRMEIRARASHPAASSTSDSEDSSMLRGTAGFGFWNYPFSVHGDILTLPESIWFFYASPPSNMALVPGIPGWGWKAQVVHSMRAGAMASVVPTVLATGWGRLTGETRLAARWLQRLSGAHETLLSAELTAWHTYTLEWRTHLATFWVDGSPVLRVPDPPARPLGFVAWLDNQYAVATPKGVLRFGTLDSGPEWFELGSISIKSL